MDFTEEAKRIYELSKYPSERNFIEKLQRAVWIYQYSTDNWKPCSNCLYYGYDWGYNGWGGRCINCVKIKGTTVFSESGIICRPYCRGLEDRLENLVKIIFPYDGICKGMPPLECPQCEDLLVNNKCKCEQEMNQPPMAPIPNRRLVNVNYQDPGEYGHPRNLFREFNTSVPKRKNLVDELEKEDSQLKRIKS